jgi:hypothetical protein
MPRGPARGARPTAPTRAMARRGPAQSRQMCVPANTRPAGARAPTHVTGSLSTTLGLASGRFRHWSVRAHIWRSGRTHVSVLRTSDKALEFTAVRSAPRALVPPAHPSPRGRARIVPGSRQPHTRRARQPSDRHGGVPITASATVGRCCARRHLWPVPLVVRAGSLGCTCLTCSGHRIDGRKRRLQARTGHCCPRTHVLQRDAWRRLQGR